jgi:hypothetical protein
MPIGAELIRRAQCDAQHAPALPDPSPLPAHDLAPHETIASQDGAVADATERRRPRGLSLTSGARRGRPRALERPHCRCSGPDPEQEQLAAHLRVATLNEKQLAAHLRAGDPERGAAGCSWRAIGVVPEQLAAPWRAIGVLPGAAGCFRSVRAAERKRRVVASLVTPWGRRRSHFGTPRWLCSRGGLAFSRDTLEPWRVGRPDGGLRSCGAHVHG